MNDEKATLRAVENFLVDCPNDLDFPAGGDVKIPLESELKMVNEIEAVMPFSNESLVLVREKLTMCQSYQLMIFAVRMGILALRTGKMRFFDVAIIGLVIDGNILDWRDTLRALSIMEDCADRLGVDFRGKLEKFEPLMSDKLRETVFEGYLSREPIMRSIEVMGFAVEMGEEGIQYVNII